MQRPRRPEPQVVRREEEAPFRRASTTGSFHGGLTIELPPLEAPLLSACVYVHLGPDRFDLTAEQLRELWRVAELLGAVDCRVCGEPENPCQTHYCPPRERRDERDAS